MRRIELDLLIGDGVLDEDNTDEEIMEFLNSILESYLPDSVFQETEYLPLFYGAKKPIYYDNLKSGKNEYN